MNKYLPYIDDDILIREVSLVVNTNNVIKQDKIDNFYKNVIDPFSAVFDAAIKQIPLKLWIDLEKVRQNQKTLQNKLGNFHQRILGNSYGWEDLKVGNLIDIRNDKLKIVAEVKNKYNTTKGSDKVVIYDNLKQTIEKKFKGYTGYYVEIVPQSKKQYNIPFTPSDNKTSSRRPENKKIRVIDGKTFYDLATGHKNSLEMLYRIIPEVLTDILKIPMNQILKDDLFETLFKSTYK